MGAWSHPAPLLVGIFVVLLLCVWLGTALSRWARSRRSRRRNLHASVGEDRAEHILRAHGYRVIARQVRVRSELSIDGVVESVGLRADFLVEKAGQRYVADAKTGSRATSVGCAATRRQLLEYRLAYDVDGVLLVDADAERVAVVCFLDVERRLAA